MYFTKSTNILPTTTNTNITRYGFRDMFVGEGGPCVDIAQPDIAAAGGISEFMKIAALGEIMNINTDNNDKYLMFCSDFQVPEYDFFALFRGFWGFQGVQMCSKHNRILVPIFTNLF